MEVFQKHFERGWDDYHVGIGGAKINVVCFSYKKYLFTKVLLKKLVKEKYEF